MYMIAGLCMLKLYQKRHPDINASAYSAYACLAIVIFFSVLGVVRPWPTLLTRRTGARVCTHPHLPPLPERPLLPPWGALPAWHSCQPSFSRRRAGRGGGRVLSPAPPHPCPRGPPQVFGKGNTAFWIVFSIIHITATLLLSTQLYYMGRWKLGEGLPRACRGWGLGDLAS